METIFERGRKEVKLTGVEVAKRVAISTTAYYAIEKGKAVPKRETFEKIKKVLMDAGSRVFDESGQELKITRESIDEIIAAFHREAEEASSARSRQDAAEIVALLQAKYK
jgi:DNA-binding XRE family transcriptional regulator